MTQRSSKELDAIDARLRVLINELPSKASPTRNPEHARIVFMCGIARFNSAEISQHPLLVSQLAMALMDLPEIIG